MKMPWKKKPKEEEKKYRFPRDIEEEKPFIYAGNYEEAAHYAMKLGYLNFRYITGYPVGYHPKLILLVGTFWKRKGFTEDIEQLRVCLRPGGINLPNF